MHLVVLSCNFISLGPHRNSEENQRKLIEEDKLDESPDEDYDSESMESEESEHSSSDDMVRPTV